MKFYYWSLALKVRAPPFLHKRWEDNKMQLKCFVFLQIFLCRRRVFVTYKSRQRLARAPRNTISVQLRESDASAMCGAVLITGAAATDELLGWAQETE
jgi:hypothetical protein